MHPTRVVREDERGHGARPMDIKKRRGVDDGDFALPDDEANEFGDEEEDEDFLADDEDDDLDGEDDDVDFDDEYEEEEYDEDEDLDGKEGTEE